MSHGDSFYQKVSARFGSPLMNRFRLVTAFRGWRFGLLAVVLIAVAYARPRFPYAGEFSPSY
jgi:hypothetical protein